jgi:hypothetical protein
MEVQDEIKISFGTGDVMGRCLEDQICIGAACTQGALVAASTESDAPFLSSKFDGILGLSLPKMSQHDGFNLVQQMFEAKALKRPLFSVFFSYSDDESSEVTLGDINDEHLASELFWVNVSRDSGYWEVAVDDVFFDGEGQKLCEGTYVAVDTGTSELAGPPSVIAELAKRLDVRSDCSNYQTLPKLGFGIAGRILNLEPRDYVEGADVGHCNLHVMPIDVPPPNGPLFILGIPFLQKFYTAYDQENRTIGFGVAKHAGEAAERAAALLLTGRGAAEKGAGLKGGAASKTASFLHKS